MGAKSSKSRDRVFAEQEVAAGSFEFNDAVADVFPDMLHRSIPGYAATIQAIGRLAARHVQPATNCYDLGCSLGAATLAMRHAITQADCSIIAVDLAPAMIRRCRELIAADDGDVEVTVIEADIRDLELRNASLIVMNYTLQFLPVEERAAMVEKIYDALNDDGVFVLSEKVMHENDAINKLLIELHHDFKRQNNYSDLEISRKRSALEEVLIPDSLETHHARLAAAGFRHSAVWLQHLNFVSLVATR